MNKEITATNHRRIARNTLMLYGRVLFTMLVSLYTSRVILQTLGVEDFGIYNVVGGVIVMFSFINGSMVSATQRYLNVELARGDKERLRSVFSSALQIHFLIALLMVVLGETLGLWFLSEKLVIPENRATAAMWVYQCSILVCAVNVMSTPYNADIIAHEKMSAFAYISILEVLLKLGVVYLLQLLPWDKLIVYALLLLGVQVLVRLVYTCYCHRRFDESHYCKASVERGLFREMFGFAGWSFVGNLSAVLFTQGLNMMLNIFFGPVVNAARGIAVQVQGAVQQFVTNFQMAVNPQITKNYALGNMADMHSLMFRSARFSFLLLFFLGLPILLETGFLLRVWLGTVPDNAVIFTQIMICISMLCALSNPCVVANQATGKIKQYQLVVGGILLTILPLSYLVLRLGAPAYSVFIVHFCVECVAQLARMLMLRPLIGVKLGQYLRHIYLPLLATVAVAVLLPLWVRQQLDEGWLRFLAVGGSCVLSVGLSACLLGLEKDERRFFASKFLGKLGRGQ